MTRFLFAALLSGLCATSAIAQVKMEGQLTASKACPALASIKKGTNPGNVMLEAGRSYQILGKNNDTATHYYVVVPGAEPNQRWVAIDCGSTDGTQAAAPAAPAAPAQKPVDTSQGTVKPKAPSRNFGGKTPYYVLALSWEPAFCEAMGSKPECRAQKPSSFEATHFTLHGLWPQPRRNQFCGVDPKIAALDDQHRWEDLPEPKLTAETKAALDKAMPGTQSDLERHEWIKHGTCYPADSAEQYFKDELRLAAEVNASAVQAFMAANIGKQVRADDIRAKFDEAFGKGTGRKVEVNCDRGGRISEVVLNLRGDIPGGDDLKTLLAAGDVAQRKCDAGLVDAVNRMN
ncbi:ribonuclease T2 family protein [Aestuariivirga litoralis]|uniref:ribonuclease T2 family protein n=1 Tax=Aestuariivirga litoralis TaxID=2650924 RepID=UPI0018C7B227|nr:ribonuclease T2 [Aestuariivirga litoralis]MBG1232833.1 ribonuclease T2 [Aestuariivirga litoralis]